ncbi:MAG: helix-turn-helix domain-containing protein [Cyanobacteria bacterium P01_D01_bin.156]
MQHSDGRHLSMETQNYLRQHAILLRKEGQRGKNISAYLGGNPNTVTKWYRQYKQRGNAALCQRDRGRQVGSGRTLSEALETKVKAAIRDDFADDYDIDSALWTRRG